MAHGTDQGLVRAIGKWSLVAIVINGVIGAGIFGLPSSVFRLVGAWSLVAFAACAAFTTLIVLCFAEVSSRFSATGGPYLYAREAFGSFAGFEVGWLFWVTRVTSFAANANLLASYLAFFLPAVESGAGRVIAITSVVLLLTVVNLIGVRNAAVTGNVLAISKLVPLALFIAVGVFAIAPERLTLGAMPGLGDFSSSVLLLVYAFSGFEMATIPGGESKDPRRDMPRALLTALAAVAVIYLLIQTVAIGTLPGLAASTRPLADAGGRFLGAMGAAIISAGALVSIAGNLNVTMLAASRIPFAMAERRELPRFLAATHRRFRTPHVSIFITAAVILGLALSGTFEGAAKVSVLARLAAFATTCAALPVFRRRRGASAAAFLAPAGVAVAVAALLLIAWLFAQSKAIEARDAGIAAAIGLALYFLPRLFGKDRPEL